MEEIIAKYREQYKNVPRDWKVAVIEKADDGLNHINVRQDIDWLYDDSVYYLFWKSKTKIKNLAKKLGYAEIPCETCRNIIKFWKYNEDWMWSEEIKDLFPSS